MCRGGLNTRKRELWSYPDSSQANRKAETMRRTLLRLKEVEESEASRDNLNPSAILQHLGKRLWGRGGILFPGFYFLCITNTFSHFREIHLVL